MHQFLGWPSGGQKTSRLLTTRQVVALAGLFFAVLLLTVLLASAASAQVLASAVSFRPAADSVAPVRIASDSIVVDESRPQDGWAAFHHTLVNAGITPWFAYTSDASTNLRGGTRRDLTGRALLQSGLTVDLDRVAGIGGAAFDVSLHAHDGNNGSDLVGDIQAYSNIDAPSFLGLDELTYSQELRDGALRFRVGRMDANGEFAVVEPAGEFINASAGFSPTIYSLPTYPDPRLGVNLAVRPFGWLELGAGAYQGMVARTPNGPDGALFAIGEVRTTWSGGNGRAVLGYWHHDGYAPAFNGTWQHAPHGLYGSLSQRVSGSAGDDSTAASGATLFLKLGEADERVSPFAHHLMLGVTFDSPFGVEDHGTGLMLSHVDLSNAVSAATPGNETAVELFYRFPVNQFFTIRPDLQYIVAPGGLRQAKDVTVATVRMELGF